MTADSQPRESAWRANLLGLIWGAGFGLAVCSFLILYSTSAWGVIGVFFVLGPLVLLVSIVIGVIAYRVASRRSPRLVSSGSFAVALIGATLLVLTPTVGQTIQLYWIAYSDIPAYPGSQRLETRIERGGGARVTVRMHTSARKAEVLKYYADELRNREWKIDLDPSFFSVSASKPRSTLLVYFQETNGEIRADWYRQYASH